MHGDVAAAEGAVDLGLEVAAVSDGGAAGVGAGGGEHFPSTAADDHRAGAGEEQVGGGDEIGGEVARRVPGQDGVTAVGIVEVFHDDVIAGVGVEVGVVPMTAVAP